LEIYADDLDDKTVEGSQIRFYMQKIGEWKISAHRFLFI